MCWQICRTYQDCPHMYRYDYGKCSDAKARSNQHFCVGPDGTMRSLERVIDVQDQEVSGVCPACAAQTPFSSEGSHMGLVE